MFAVECDRLVFRYNRFFELKQIKYMYISQQNILK